MKLLCEYAYSLFHFTLNLEAADIQVSVQEVSQQAVPYAYSRKVIFTIWIKITFTIFGIQTVFGKMPKPNGIFGALKMFICGKIFYITYSWSKKWNKMYFKW